MEITKELVDKLSTDDITKKEYNEIVAAIGDKVHDIWTFICEVSGRNIDWYAFQNDVSYGRGNGSSGGSFDPDTDKETIDLQGEFDHCDYDGYEYNEGFPTSFLWTDYKPIVEKHYKDAKAKHAKKKVAKRKKHDELVSSIKKKLTVEELKIVSFNKGQCY